MLKFETELDPSNSFIVKCQHKSGAYATLTITVLGVKKANTVQVLQIFWFLLHQF